jgi:formylmethanofuran dehydrogenase subunit A
MHAAQAIAVKIVNPGGISAFKFNQRQLNLDEQHVYYGVTPREIILTLARGLKELGVAHPIHIHGCNLGVPGGVETTLDTIRGSNGLPIHLTHIQFHSYDTEGDMKFSSGAARVAEAVNAHKNVSIDIGQVMFGQTCTASGDSACASSSTRARPTQRSGWSWTSSAMPGCGVVPFKYQATSRFVNALQWAIGLELFLMVNDPLAHLLDNRPSRTVAPFTCYPHLIRLLMDKTFRKRGHDARSTRMR